MSTLLYLLVFLILGTAVYGAISAAPWLPTKRKDVGRMVALAAIKPGERVYDLGCGDGRLVFEAANQGAEAIGIEIFVLPYFYAWIKSIFKKGAAILYGDLFNYDLSGADVVFVFLQDKSYKRLLAKFKKELKPGTRVVVGCWDMTDWKDHLVKEDKPTDKDLPMYLYQV